MGTLWPRSSSMEFDNNGVIAPGALAYFQEAETTTPKAVYQDGDETTPHEYPVEADGNGRWPAVYVPFGTYKVILTTAGGTILATIDNIPNPEPFDETFEVDETAQLNTGDVWFAFIDGERDGAVRLNGRSIGSATSSATERANADTADLFTFLYNALDNTAAPVSGGRGANAAADFAANKRLTLPDLRGALPIGLTDMGNSDSGGLASAPVTSGAATTPGSVLGENTHALTTAELATHLHTVSITSGIESAEHLHSVSLTAASNGDHAHTVTVNDTRAWKTTQTVVANVGSGGNRQATGAGSAWSDAAQADVVVNSGSISASDSTTGAHTHSVSGSTAGQNSNHTHLVSGNTGNNGSGSAHNVVSKVVTGTWYIKL